MRRHGARNYPKFHELSKLGRAAARMRKLNTLGRRRSEIVSRQWAGMTAEERRVEVRRRMRGGQNQ